VDHPDPRTLAGDLAAAAEAAGWEIQDLPPIQGLRRPWFVRRQPAPLASLYISAGIHGDEPAGPLGALDLLRYHPKAFEGLFVTFFPLLNPTGLRQRTRENWEGIDVNRDYKSLRTLEAKSHVEILRSLRPFDAHLCLHEDWESAGAYIYELSLNPHLPSAAPAILAAIARHLPLDPSDTIDGSPASGSIIRRNVLPHLEAWPEALYLARHGHRFGYTIETPSSHPLALRVAAQVDAALAFTRHASQISRVF
jgi:hypothetical protein